MTTTWNHINCQMCHFVSDLYHCDVHGAHIVLTIRFRSSLLTVLHYLYIYILDQCCWFAHCWFYVALWYVFLLRCNACNTIHTRMHTLDPFLYTVLPRVTCYSLWVAGLFGVSPVRTMGWFHSYDISWKSATYLCVDSHMAKICFCQLLEQLSAGTKAPMMAISVFKYVQMMGR